MLRLAVLFLLLAIVTAAAGYYDLANISWEVARILAVVFLVLAVMACLSGRRTRSEA
jgi:uncharacterized membrane protein YtjA (UPF0391 family)